MSFLYGISFLLLIGSIFNGRVAVDAFTSISPLLRINPTYLDTTTKKSTPDTRNSKRFSSSNASEDTTYETIGRQRRIDSEGSVLGLTENNALTYKKTGKKCLDFLVDVMPFTSRERVVTYLEEAWVEDPFTTLQLIIQLGDPRKGKGDKKNLYQGLLWLYKHHFETLLCNIDAIGRYSYRKSLLDLLVLAMEGRDALDDKRPFRAYVSVRVRLKAERQESRKQKVQEFYNGKEEMGSPDGFQRLPGRGGHWSSDKLRQEFIEYMERNDQEESKKARVARKMRESAMRLDAEEKYRSDEKFQRLYDKVAKYFADGLQNDRRVMESSDGTLGVLIGGYAKWAPTPNGSHDRRTNICEGIIKQLYSDCYQYRDSHLRMRFRKHYLSSIRRAAQVPESFTGSGDWNLVNYNVMPSICRMMYGEMYRQHDQERYDAFVNRAVKQAESGKRVTMVAAGALLPHQITERCQSGSNSDELNKELGLQWLRLIQDVKDKGDLRNALAICDVSHSMTGEPMDVSIALGMLLSDITSGPFANKVVTFSEKPELVRVPKATVDNLASRAYFMKGMNWGYSTDFQAVFGLILKRAVEERVPMNEMPSILFCFSDMEFDEARQTGSARWKTDLELIRSKYSKAGYNVPTIVFWNLRDSSSKAVSYEEEGVVMMSGFSAGMLKCFMECRLNDIPTPFEQMIKMLRFYDDLVLAPEDEI